MKALKIAGIISLCSIVNDARHIRGALLGGDISTIGLCDGGVMIVDGCGETHGKPYNQLASLVAGERVYGIALIVGADDVNDDFDDVPEAFLSLLGMNDD